MAPMKSVLMVCWGNICRSPAAESIFREYCARRGVGTPSGAALPPAARGELSSLAFIDSCGTNAFHIGERADPRMRAATAQRTPPLELTSRSRQIVDDDFARFDVIVVMDTPRLRELRAMGRARPGQLRLWSEFANAPGATKNTDGAAWPTDTPDPYYGGDDGFAFVLRMLDAGCPALFAHCTTSGDDAQ